MHTTNIKLVQEEIDKHSESIAEELASIKIWDNQKIIPVITVRVKDAITKCLALFKSDVDHKRTEIVKQYNDPYISTLERQKLKSKITEINEHQKIVNKTYSSFRELNEYWELKQFLKKQYPDAYQEFIKIQNQ